MPLPLLLPSLTTWFWSPRNSHCSNKITSLWGLHPSNPWLTELNEDIIKVSASHLIIWLLLILINVLFTSLSLRVSLLLRWHYNAELVSAEMLAGVLVLSIIFAAVPGKGYTQKCIRNLRFFFTMRCKNELNKILICRLLLLFVMSWTEGFHNCQIFVLYSPCIKNVSTLLKKNNLNMNAWLTGSIIHIRSCSQVSLPLRSSYL